MVVMCHVTWIMVLVVLGPPKRLDGSIAGESFFTTTTSPATPWMAAPRMARNPARISGTFIRNTAPFPAAALFEEVPHDGSVPGGDPAQTVRAMGFAERGRVEKSRVCSRRLKSSSADKPMRERAARSTRSGVLRHTSQPSTGRSGGVGSSFRPSAGHPDRSALG